MGADVPSLTHTYRQTTPADIYIGTWVPMYMNEVPMYGIWLLM